MPVRPSACTPDSRVSGYIDAAAASPAGRTSSAAGAAAAAWNANCTIGSAGTQSTTTGLHQTNHTFYPWMAIAGEFHLPIIIIIIILLLFVYTRKMRGCVLFLHLIHVFTLTNAQHTFY